MRKQINKIKSFKTHKKVPRLKGGEENEKERNDDRRTKRAKKESEEQQNEEDGRSERKNNFGTSQKALRNQTACSLWVLTMRLSSLSLSLAPASPDIFLLV
jgi:hypothetical protein